MIDISNLKESNQHKTLYGHKVNIAKGLNWDNTQDLITIPNKTCILKAWIKIKYHDPITSYTIYVNFNDSELNQVIQTPRTYPSTGIFELDSLPAFFPEDKEFYLMSMDSLNFSEPNFEAELYFQFLDYNLNDGTYFSNR